MNNKKTKIFAMPNIKDLGEKIAKQLEMSLSEIKHITFSDGESLLSSKETVRNQDIFIIASTSKPVNENIMQLLLFVDSLKRASAKTITVLLSYYGYSRQDRKAEGRQPIGAKLFADILEKAGVNKIITVDLHNPSIQGFFNIPSDDLKSQYIFSSEIQKLGKFTIASPDHGGAVRARFLAELISNTVDIAIVDKRRVGTNKTETMGILGTVKGNNVVIFDDMIDTGGTIIKAAQAIKLAGAKKIIIAATHGLFTNGFDKFENCKEIEQVIVTDSISSVSKIKSNKLTILSLSLFLSSVIKAIQNSKSISSVSKQMKK